MSATTQQSRAVEVNLWVHPHSTKALHGLSHFLDFLENILKAFIQFFQFIADCFCCIRRFSCGIGDFYLVSLVY